MKFTKGQLRERENLEWFCNYNLPRTDDAFKAYLDFSERGVPVMGDNYYAVAKSRRGVTIHELWEDSFYKGEWFGWDSLLREENGEPIKRHIA